ncbi:MAG: cobalamin-dependent protein, partial [Chloroflexota bacterium]|nr:cobalamin-dependent protein [Chloroflexota bacterium]
VQAAAQEDVDVVGLSILSGAHRELVPQVVAGLREKEMGDVVVVVGGIVPEEDKEALGALGVTGVFGPGTSTQAIVEFIQRAVSTGAPRG